MSSNKIKWYKSMTAKIEYQEKLKDLAAKTLDGVKEPSSLSKKNKKNFALYVEEAKIEREKRLARERKKKV